MLIISKSRRQGFTILELLIAVVISSMMIVAMVSTTIFTSRILKSNFNQQQSVFRAKLAIEQMGQMVRQAARPMYVKTAAGVATAQGNRVDFGFAGEPATRRRIELLPGPDNDIMTPWDNILVIDPNTTIANNEQRFNWFSPVSAAGAFSYTNGALNVMMRRGDPAIAATNTTYKANSDARTGQGMQGVEVNIRFSPRNSND